MRRYSSGQRGLAVNQLAYAYGGSNPPRRTQKDFARTVLTKSFTISDFYLKVIAEFYRVIKNNGEIILLTSNLEELTDAISQNKLVLKSKHEISLNGEIAYIFVIQKI